MTGLDEHHVRDIVRKHCRINGIQDSADGRLVEAIAGALAELHPEVALLTEMSVLNLQPGDILVCTTTENLTDEQADVLGHQLRTRFPDNKITLLEGGLKLAVVRPTSKGAPA